MASSMNILRQVRLFVAVAGNNSGQYPQHVYLVRVEDEEGALVWSNADEELTVESGSTDKGFHKGPLRWLAMWNTCILDHMAKHLPSGDGTADAIAQELKAPRRLTIIAPRGDRTFAAYSHSAENLLANKFRKADGKPWANAAWIARTLTEAEELGVTVTCREPETVQESATLDLLQSETKRRWKKAMKALTAQFA